MKQHSTMPNEPEEAPATSPKPEINQPHDPQEPKIAPEAPQREPQEMPPPSVRPEFPPM